MVSGVSSSFSDGHSTSPYVSLSSTHPLPAAPGCPLLRFGLEVGESASPLPHHQLRCLSWTVITHPVSCCVVHSQVVLFSPLPFIWTVSCVFEKPLCACVFSHVQLFVAPWAVAHQAPLSVGFSRQEYWRELPRPPLGDFSDPGIKPVSLTSPALAGRFFTTSATWEAWEKSFSSVQFSSVAHPCPTPWTAAHQASLSFTNSWSLLKLMSIESVMPSNQSPSVIPFSSHLQSFPASGSFPVSQFFVPGGQSIGVSASASVFPMNIQDWFPLGWTGIDLLAVQGTLKSPPNSQHKSYQFFSVQPSLWPNSHIHTWLLWKNMTG